MNKDITRDTVYLAALLHDIGKFWQRADTSYYKSKNLEKYPYVVGNAGRICPTAQEGYFKYQHVIWTQLFFEENIEIFKKLGIYDENERDNLVNVSIHHHKPETKLQALIQFADWWASGIDRSEAKEYEVKRGKLKFKEEPLVSIFGNLTVRGKTGNVLPKPTKPAAFGLQPLSLRKPLFPGQEKYEQGVSQEEYAQLWEQFSLEFKKLPTDSLSVFNTSLHYLLKKYGWCIPASTIDFADNSLFDHLKITAAIAQSLYDYQVENPASFSYDRRLALQAGHLPLLLLCVDTTGIQKFIYDISSRYAAKSLKGRSFSLQLMLDEIASSLIQKTHTTLSHVIYSSGGKFFMLLPNTEKIRAELAEFEREIEKAIWEKYKGKIYICLGFEAFAYDKDLKKNNAQGALPIMWIGEHDKPAFLGDLWRRVSEKTAERKYQKFRTLLTTDFDDFFYEKGIGLGGLTELCSVSGEEVEKGLTQIDENVKISPQILEQKQIGEAMAKNSFLVFSHDRQHNLPSHKKFSTLLGRNYWVVGKGELLATENAEVCLTVQGDIDFLKPVSARATSYSYRFYGGSEAALDARGNPKNFEQLAGIERENHDRDDSPIVREQCRGSFNRIGILRMDVDGLGQLFIKGFDPANASFSAYATLSGQLDWFFSGFLNTIRGKSQYRDWVNIIYSGGDDVFAVGRWDEVIGFADEVQREFRKFTNRPDITISAGISIVTPKFPIAKGAADAGAAEEAAKDFERSEGPPKNALCLLGIVVGWEEFDTVVKMKEFWIKNLRADQPILSRGILQKMFDWYAVANRKDENGNPDLSWKWNATYSLKRHQTKDLSPRNDALKIIEKILFLGQFQVEDFPAARVRFEAFILACRWAELELRDNKR